MSIESLGADLLDWGATVNRDVVQRGMERFQDGWNPSVPVDTGTFRASLMPWSGTESTEVPAKAPQPPLGHAEIAAALESFELGEPAGFAERQVYTAFLLGGSSSQAPNLEADLDVLCAEVAAG